jgi:hypothetical protein
VLAFGLLTVFDYGIIPLIFTERLIRTDELNDTFKSTSSASIASAPVQCLFSHANVDSGQIP